MPNMVEVVVVLLLWRLLPLLSPVPLVLLLLLLMEGVVWKERRDGSSAPFYQNWINRSIRYQPHPSIRRASYLFRRCLRVPPAAAVAAAAAVAPRRATQREMVDDWLMMVVRTMTMRRPRAAA